MSESIPSNRSAGATQGATVVAVSFLNVLTVVALPPTLPKIMAFFRDNPNAEVLAPLLVTVPGLAVALLSPFAGWVVDRYGKRWPLIISIALFGLFGILPAALNDLNLIIASRIGVGFSLTFIVVIGTALIADYFPENQRRTWLTVQGLGMPLFAAAALLGSGALAQADWHYAFLTYAVALPVLIAAFLFCYEPTRQARDGTQTAQTAAFFPWRSVIRVCVVSCVIAVFFFTFIIFSGLALASIGVDNGAQLGGIIGAISMTCVIGALLFNYLSRHVSAEVIAAIQIAIMGIGLIGIGLAPNLWTMIMFGIVHQIGAGMMVPTTIFWMAQVLPAEQRGSGFGILTTMSAVGQFVVPFVVTLGHTIAGGLRPGLAVVGVVAAVCGLVLLLWSRSFKPSVAAEPVTRA